MRLGRNLTTWLFAVTMLTAGAWAQSSDYPQQPPPPPQQGQGVPPQNGGSNNDPNGGQYGAPGANQNGGQNGQDQGSYNQGSYDQDSNQDAAPDKSGPQLDVARISLIKGDVSTQRGDTGDWAVTSVNAPLVRGDQVATGENARAEIQLDYANIVRLAGRSQIKVADLASKRIQLQVAQGYASYTMLKSSDADVELDTPNVAVHPLKAGRYRVQVKSDAETDVIVREGEAEITTPEGSTRVHEGQVIEVRGAENPEYRVADAPVKDDWDQWNRDRDYVVNSSESVSKTNRYYTGVNDLDGYGHWVWVPGYGNVWQPYNTSATWAPYQSGRWVYEPYWGWTWVSYEPWGWAPYHYGRWFLYSGNWCWWPGPVYVSYRPVWSPAFVFFVGFGHHSSFGFGSIGWFPVGPHDAFYPWWGRGFNRVNVVNVTNINVINGGRGHYIAPLAVRGRQPFFSNARLVETNARMRGSITTVSSENFGRGDFHDRRFGVDEREWREGRVMTANLPVVPSRENLRVSATGGAGRPADIHVRDNERFFTRHAPPAGPESFHDQKARIDRAVGPEAVNARTDMHGGNQVERRDVGTLNNGRGNEPSRGNMEVPRNDVPRNENARGNLEVPRNDVPRNDRPGGEATRGNMEVPRNDHPGNDRHDSPGRIAPGATEGMAQNNPPNNNGGNSGQSNRGDSNNRSDNNSRNNNHDNGGWSRFGQPGNSGQQGGRDSGRGEPAGRNDSSGRGEPSGRNDSPGHGDPNANKPPLELRRPIVSEPRQDSGRPDSRNDRGYNPPPSRTPDARPDTRPDNRNERPSYTPPSGGRSESPRYSPPPSRSESPRYSPPPRSDSSRGAGSSSHGSSSSHSGSGDRGSHNDSKSSSSPKHH